MNAGRCGGEFGVSQDLPAQCEVVAAFHVDPCCQEPAVGLPGPVPHPADGLLLRLHHGARQVRSGYDAGGTVRVPAASADCGTQASAPQRAERR